MERILKYRYSKLVSRNAQFLKCQRSLTSMMFPSAKLMRNRKIRRALKSIIIAAKEAHQ
jgi:hypothetical protein